MANLEELLQTDSNYYELIGQTVKKINEIGSSSKQEKLKY